MHRSEINVDLGALRRNVRTLLRTGRDSLSEIVGADAATLTAEDWPAV